jgi:hypothetical protein
MRTPITDNYLRAFDDKEEWARDMTPIDLCHQIEKRLCEAEKITELARVLLMHAVSGILDGCGNSYANAYTEQWLTHAKELGAYHGRTIGKIRELEQEWEEWLGENGGLPDWPDITANTTMSGHMPPK